MISMELVLLGDIPLGVWIVRLPSPLDCVAHVLHDGYALNGFDIECILRDSSWSPWCTGRSLG